MKNHGSTIHVLLTDDDADDLMLFQEAIKETSIPVSLSAAENGSDLFKMLGDNYHPNFIFLDVNMPGKSGKDCLLEIRSNPHYRTIPVIMYSTSNSKEDIDTCYQRGANMYVIKPIFFNDMVRTLRKIFSLRLQEFYDRTKDQFVFS